MEDITLPDYDTTFGLRWDYNLKWKPVEDNSIDFLVKFAQEKDPVTGLTKDKVFNDAKGVIYKIAHLYCGFKTNKKGGQYIAKKFTPITPFEEDAYIVYLPIKDRKLVDENNMPIANNTIIEFVYAGFDDKEGSGSGGSGGGSGGGDEDEWGETTKYIENKFLRWKPLRTRYDKTFEYRNSQKMKRQKINVINKLFFEEGYIFKILDKYTYNISFMSDFCHKGRSLINKTPSDNTRDVRYRVKVFEILNELIQKLIATSLLKQLFQNEQYYRLHEKQIYNDFNYYVNELRNICIHNLPYRKNADNNFNIYGNNNRHMGPVSYLIELLKSFQVPSNTELLLNIEKTLNISSNYGNDFKTANNNWRNIHFPITYDMIFKGKNIVSKKDYYYKTDLSKNRNDCPGINIRNFHNYIKGILFTQATKLLRYRNQDNEIRLLELACGKAQDLFKWCENNINLVVGIDYKLDNIENEINGANIRYMQNKDDFIKNKVGICPSVHFIVGDISKNIKSMDAFKLDTRGEYRKLAQRLWSDKKDNLNVKQFNLISIQFAIHYLFGTKDMLDGLINNIDDNLTLGGVLIGTCFNGETLWNEMKKLATGESIYQNIEDKHGNVVDSQVLWRIIKNYTNRQRDDNSEEFFPEDVRSLGHSVQVYIKSINVLIEEYLVNMKYLIKRLAERNIRILEDEDSKIFYDYALSSSSVSASDMKSYEKRTKIEMFEAFYTSFQNKRGNKLSEKEKKWSYLNRTFVFKKYGSPEDSIWNRFKRKIIEDCHIRSVVEENDSSKIRSLIKENYLQEGYPNRETILTNILHKLKQEKYAILNDRNPTTDKYLDGPDVPFKKDPDRTLLPEYDANLLDGSHGGDKDAGRVNLTSQKVNDHQEKKRKLRECFNIMQHLFHVYTAFLNGTTAKITEGSKSKLQYVKWNTVINVFPERSAIDECFKILQTALNTPDFYELMQAYKLAINMYTSYFDHYMRRRNDSKLQEISQVEKVENANMVNRNNYIKVATYLQECVLDYVGRIVDSSKVDLMHLTIFTEELTVDKIPPIRSEASSGLLHEVDGVQKLMKTIKSETVDYEQTKFAKFLRLYGKKKLDTYISLLKKLSSGKSKKVTDKIPQIFVDFYEYVVKRFISKYKETESGKRFIQAGGAVLSNSTKSLVSVTESMRELYDSHQFSEEHLNAEHYDFMKYAHDNYQKYKQIGGNIQQLVLLTNPKKVQYCEKYALTQKNHPTCREFLGSVNDLKAYIKSQINKIGN